MRLHGHEAHSRDSVLKEGRSPCGGPEAATGGAAAYPCSNHLGSSIVGVMLFQSIIHSHSCTPPAWCPQGTMAGLMMNQLHKVLCSSEKRIIVTYYSAARYSKTYRTIQYPLMCFRRLLNVLWPNDPKIGLLNILQRDRRENCRLLNVLWLFGFATA